MARKNRAIQQSTSSTVMTNTPKIVAFICNWQSKDKKKHVDFVEKKYSAKIKFFRVMCAARIDRALLLKCVQEKIDGIFIGICNHEMCHYRGALELSEQRFENTIDLLDALGYDKSRIQVYEDDGDSTNSLPKVLEEFTQKVNELGEY